MRRARIVLLCAAALVLAACAWLWWNRPERADMAAYVPADSIVYLEANDLPGVLGGLASTDAWRELAPAAGLGTDFRRVGWLSRVAAWTGAGPAEAVVLARAQVAVTVLGFEAAEESGETLKITPRAALVAETHTSAWRVRPVVERLVGDFARRAYGQTSIERKEVDGTPFIIWRSASDKRRQIVAAVSESVAVVGNDEAAVQDCLAVRRGERPSLAGNHGLEEMRRRVDAAGALAFGYAPAGSAAKIVEIFAPAFVTQATSKPEAQSVLAVLLPELTNKLLGDAGWSARVSAGAVEDRYFLSPAAGVAQRLAGSLVPVASRRGGAGEFLPADAYQVSRYTLHDPEAAWVGLNAAIASQVEVTRAPIIVLALEALLKPYGVESPREFLRAAGPEIATARLESASESKLLLVTVRDTEALRAQVRRHLGAGARVKHLGDEEMLVSSEPERGAASFVGDYLLMGGEDDVRRCLAARASGHTLMQTESYSSARTGFLPDPPLVTTLTEEQETARSVIDGLVELSGRGAGAKDEGEMREALARRPYSVSETRLVSDGFSKVTRSAFGLLGELMTRLAPGR